MKSASASRLIASVALAGGLLWALIRWGGVELSDITETISDITLTQWLTALAVHSGIYLLRAWRFSVLTPTELRPPFWKVLVLKSFIRHIDFGTCVSQIVKVHVLVMIVFFEEVQKRVIVMISLNK